MTINVGVIGTGMIGTVHVRNLAGRVAGSRVTAVTDVDRDQAQRVASEVGARAIPSSEELIRRKDVDAVVLATPGFTHAEIVLDALDVGKPIMCEKPLATEVVDALRVLEAEEGGGSRLIQVGFMRRFDPGYVEVKSALESGSIGVPLMAHMFHRNASVPDHFSDEMVINESFVHEVDVTRWLFGEEIVSAGLLYPRASPEAPPGLHDPQVLILETESGAVIIAEAYVANGFGYDVRCEIVGSIGTSELATPRFSRRTGPGSVSEHIYWTWKERFGETYRLELQAWVDSIRSGQPVGPSAWDGYAATAVSAAGAQAIGKNGQRVAVEMVSRPRFYA